MQVTNMHQELLFNNNPISSAMAEVSFGFHLPVAASKLNWVSRDNEYILTSYRYEQQKPSHCLF